MKSWVYLKLGSCLGSDHRSTERQGSEDNYESAMTWGPMDSSWGRREGGDMKGVTDIEVMGLLTNRGGRRIAGVVTRESELHR